MKENYREKKLEPMTEQEYLAKRGLGDIVSGYSIDKVRGNRQLKTQRGQKKFFRDAQQAENEYQERRRKAKEEYRNFVETGVLRDKTPLEKALDKAHGHPDNPATQAARRILAKRGYNWKTGEKCRINSYNLTLPEK